MRIKLDPYGASDPISVDFPEIPRVGDWIMPEIFANAIATGPKDQRVDLTRSQRVKRVVWQGEPWMNDRGVVTGVLVVLEEIPEILALARKAEARAKVRKEVGPLAGRIP